MISVHSNTLTWILIIKNASKGEPSQLRWHSKIKNLFMQNSAKGNVSGERSCWSAIIHSVF